MKKIILFFALFICLRSSAQKIYGIVLNNTGDLLPYSSISIKGTTIGAGANVNAKFSISVSPGTYTVVCQHIGFAAQEKSITVGKGEEVNTSFVLSEQKYTMKEVIVKTNGEDPAYEVIRQAIKKREEYNKQVNSFQCELYSKNLIKLKNLPGKIFGKKISEDDKTEMGVDSTGKGIIYLSESNSKISFQQQDKLKVEVTSTRVSGSNDFGFTFLTFINLYQNNVTLFTDKFNPRGFISPIANGALNFYKYKFLGSFWENGKEINAIKVIPKRAYEPLFSGIINITEGDWRIHSVDLVLTRTTQLQILDTLKLTQFHVAVTDDVWRVKNQLINFDLNQLGIGLGGNFLSVYSNYSIDPSFPKKYFDNVIIKYDTGVNKKPKTFWDTSRPVPLEREEALDYEVKDSLFDKNSDTAWTQAKVDSLKRKQGPLKPYTVIWQGIDRTHYSVTNRYDWGVEALLPVLEYNPAEGFALNINGFYRKTIGKQKTRLSIEPHVRYGFSNTHLNGWLDINFRQRGLDEDQKIKRQLWSFSGGKRVSQFNRDYNLSTLNSSLSTLLWGDNYIKFYENYFGSITYARRLENGLRLSVNALYEDRLPMDNTTDFTIFTKSSIKITPNYPFQRIPSQITRSQALLLSATVSFKPGQKYIQFPDRKVSLGSNYPTFTFNYTKGVPDIFGSDADFDKWKLEVNDDVNFKLAGLLKYRVAIGGFINNRSVDIQDYQHFNANNSVLAGAYVSSFQLANYFVNSTTDKFFSFVNIDHHFNGLLTNKIPLIKKWDWNLTAGANALYVNKDNHYEEVFIGLENILKIFRVDYVVGWQNKTLIHSFCIGTGGILGDHINVNAVDPANTIKF
ncbi:DUF5686 and carboxypeptidase regulatory-like domain-containing protein [Ferruginibacter albus]|uniref:DUF5686 and carboxypeptidase regulatory-like domain-containing protein n=1 Tax=Ferruginibacter albus TaxID=2875540 RepID=UPI001CC53E5F|nr:DUF5686 and carboxypeptidase regulatory-like domain-containing protein [Ferruginibacter albus]UAY51031.1 DUF5686 and carboxypeptidase regulatory-like domain-containing protein [Ferruginibacter albus]